MNPTAPILSMPCVGSACARLRAVLAGQRVALGHDWLLGMRGGEWVLDALLDLFPNAEVHALFHAAPPLAGRLNRHAIHPSWLNRMPLRSRFYRWTLPIMPSAVRSMTPHPATRLLLTTSHSVIHGMAAPPAAARLSYVFSPMRYLYDQQQHYRAQGLGGRLLGAWSPRLSRWDYRAAARAGRLITLSHFVARRIRQVWDREAEVIYPPVRTEVFTPPPHDSPVRREEFLVVSAMVPYKRVDLAIQAANRLRLPLRVVGGGPMLAQMRQLAGPTVHIEGPVDEARLVRLYRTRRALIFTAEEDFGIVPLEAMACGMPVVGLRAGGLTETLPEGVCGEFFDHQSVESLVEVLARFDSSRYATAALRAHAEKFALNRFFEEISATVLDELNRTV